mmetsp:Transcript_35604/g.91794  ORF Transcript_35604/g.91794 Transcript_35604/m.91794 type:complete len:358 (+) Transcript_35604:138-1211(+)
MSHLQSGRTLKQPNKASWRASLISKGSPSPVSQSRIASRTTSLSRPKKDSNSKPRWEPSRESSGQPRSLLICSRPHVASKTTTPKAQMSVALRSSVEVPPWPMAFRTSGAANGMVPQIFSSRALLTSSASPKSTRRAAERRGQESSSLNTMLSCFTSLWAMPMPCMYFSASATCPQTSQMSISSNFPCASMASHSVAFPASSITMQMWCRVWMTPKRRTIPMCLNFCSNVNSRQMLRTCTRSMILVFFSTLTANLLPVSWCELAKTLPKAPSPSFAPRMHLPTRLPSSSISLAQSASTMGKPSKTRCTQLQNILLCWRASDRSVSVSVPLCFSASSRINTWHFFCQRPCSSRLRAHR